MVVPRILLLMVVWHSCQCLPTPSQAPQQPASKRLGLGDFVEDQVDFVQDAAEDALKMANQVSGPALGVSLFDPPVDTGPAAGSPAGPSPQGGIFGRVAGFTQTAANQMTDSLGSLGSSVQSQMDLVNDQASQFGDSVHSALNSFGGTVESQLNPFLDQVQDQANQFGDSLQSTLGSFGSTVKSQLNPVIDQVQDQANQFVDSVQGAVDNYGRTMQQPSSFSFSVDQDQQPEIIGGIIKGTYDAFSGLNPFGPPSGSPSGGSSMLTLDVGVMDSNQDQPRLGLGLVNSEGMRDIVTGGLKLVGLDKVFGPVLQGISDVGETTGRVFGTTIDGIRKVASQAGETTLEVVGGPYRSFVDTKRALGGLKVDTMRNTRELLERLGGVAKDKIRNAANLAMDASMDAATAALDTADAFGKFTNRAASDTFFTVRNIGQAKVERITEGMDSILKLGSTVGEALEDTVSAFLPPEDPVLGGYFMKRKGTPQ